jgi:CubicO group peptidase (beta-lactamase class C family)
MSLTIRSLLVAAAIVAPQAVAAQADSTAWADTLRAEMHSRLAPGAAVVVIHEGRVVWQSAMGVRSVEQAAVVTPATLFRIGSVTKMFTGLLAAEMAHAGLIDLDAPVSRIAPELPPALGAVTLTELLTHRAGVINLAANNGSHDDDALAARVATWRDDVVFAPRDDIYSYSSPGYWLSGYLLERAAGLPYADLLARRILEPLGLQHSTLRPLMAMTRELALDHVRGSGGVVVQRPFLDDASTWPSGSLFASVRDLALVTQALLGVTPAIASDVITLATTPHAAPGGGPYGYALGLAASRRGSHHALSHYGYRAGSGSVFTIVPATRTAVIILANGPGAILTRTEGTILRALLGPDVPPQGTRPVIHQWALEPARYAQGTDTLVVTRQEGTTILVARGDTLSLTQDADGDLLARNAQGRVAAGFSPIVGRSGRKYLHDGLSAYGKVEDGG